MKVLNFTLMSCSSCGSRDLQIDTEYGVSRCKKCKSCVKSDPIWVEVESFRVSSEDGFHNSVIYSFSKEEIESHEANNRDPMDSALKYVEMMKDFEIMDEFGGEIEALYMIELDILWKAAMRDKEAAKIVKGI